MAISLTPEEKVEVQREDFLIRPLPGATGALSGTFHNPVTGREIHRQPMDAVHITRKLQKGWALGPASPELREKWKIREAELRAEDDAREAEYLASHEHVEAERARFNDAVKEAAAIAVAAILEEKGIALPDAGAERTPRPAPAPEGKQLEFDLPEDAPSESDTKHVVSQASRPALHLVE
jgi:hypothetical protein